MFKYQRRFPNQEHANHLRDAAYWRRMAATARRREQPALVPGYVGAARHFIARANMIREWTERGLF